MPAAATVRREKATLAFAGALDRAAVPDLWSQAQALAPGAQHFDLAGVTTVDSAGLALLVELAQRVGGVSVTGDPPGLDGLRRAYRLSPSLSFAQA